jgi:hypothetical protein
MKFVKKVWQDQVGSKVIAGGILFIFAQIGIYLIGLYNSLNFIETYENIPFLIKELFSNINWILIVIISLVTLVFLIFIFLKLKNIVINYFKKQSKKGEEEIKIETEIRDEPTVFFNNRFRDAFPGFSNDFKQFESRREIHKRLKILLKEPLKFDEGSGYGIDKRPIWWFRDSGAMPIEKFKILNRKKILLNSDEFIINKIVAYRGSSYFKDFVYIECLPDKPTGLYEHDSTYLESRVKENRGYQEEFGVFKNKFITRQEFDDASALINGKPVQTFGAELRSRSLTKYNFILAAKFSPYNCRDFTRNSGEYFGKLIRKEIEFNEFVEWMKELPKNPND